MARKKKKQAATRSARRTSDQIIKDLQEEIRRVRATAKAKELKDSPGFREAARAIAALDKAHNLAKQEKNSLLRHNLAESRRVLASFLDKAGMPVPKLAMPRGRKPKGL